MTSLGELTLDLRLNDKGYAKDIEAARKRAEALDREFVSVLRADTKNFLDAFQQAEKVKNRLDRIITAEFRVNTNQIQGALNIAENARREFKKQQNTTFTADNTQFIAAVREIRAARRNIDKPITVKIGVNVKGLFSAVGNAFKSIERLKKPVEVPFKVQDREFRKAVTTSERIKKNFTKPVTVTIKAAGAPFFKVFKNAEAAKKRLGQDVTVDLRTRGEDRLLKLLKEAQAAKKNLSGNSLVNLRVKSDSFFRTFKNAEAAKKTFRKPAETELKTKAEKFFTLMKRAEDRKKKFGKTIAVEIEAKTKAYFTQTQKVLSQNKRLRKLVTVPLTADAKKLFTVVKNVQKFLKELRKPITVEFLVQSEKLFKALGNARKQSRELRKGVTVKLEANAKDFNKKAQSVEKQKAKLKKAVAVGIRGDARNFFQAAKRAEREKAKLRKSATIKLNADAKQFFKATKRIETEKRQFRQTATTELRVNAGQFFRGSKAAKAEKKELGTRITTTIRLAKDQYRQDLKQAKGDVRDLKSEFGRGGFKLPRVNSRDFEGSIRDAGGRGRNILAGVFQGIGQEIFQTVSTALTSALAAPIKGGVGAIAAFSDVEAGLVNFEAKARSSVDSAEELAAVSAKVASEAERIGIETSKTPAQVAQIATRMIELGASASQAANNVDGVITALESTGFTDIDKTAKSFQLASNVFGEASEDFADKLALLTSSTAVTTATDVEQAFGKAGGAFKAAGQDLESLLALFSGFRSASGPEIAATATRNAVAKLLPPADRAVEIIDKLGITLFDSAGEALPILTVLEDLKSRVEDLPQEERLRFLQKVFDRRSASEIALILEQLDQVRSTYDGLRNDSTGVAKQLQKDLNQGVAAAVVRLQGTVETLAGAFGKVLGPAAETAIRGLTGALNSVTEAAAGGLFDPLADSIQRLFASIGGGTLTVDSLGQSFVSVADTIQGALASVIDRFTEFIQSNPTALQDFANNFANSFSQVTETVGQLLTQVGSIGAPIVEIAQNLFQGLAGQSDVLVGALATVGAVLAPLTSILKALSDNALLVDIAFKVLIAKIIALKALNFVGTVAGFATGLVNLTSKALAAGKALKVIAAGGKGLAAFSAAAGPVSAFTTALGGLAATAAIATAALSILTAAIAAGLFIKAVFDVRNLNKEIEVLASNTSTLGNSSINAAQNLKNAIAEANKERAKGLDIDQRAVQQRIKLAEEEKKALLAQRRDLEKQLSKAGNGLFSNIPGFRGVGQAQRNALESQIKETEAAEKALNGQISAANELLAAEEQRLQKVDELRQQDLESFEEQERAKEESAKERLDNLVAANEKAVKAIEKSQSSEIRAVRQLELDESISAEESAARQIEIQQNATQKLISEYRAQQSALKSAISKNEIDAKEGAKQRLTIEENLGKALDREIDLQIQRQQALRAQQIQSIKDQYSELESEISSQQFDIQTSQASLGSEQELLNAQRELQSALTEGAISEANAKKEAAVNAKNATDALKAQQIIESLKTQDLAKQQAFDLRSLELKQEASDLTLQEKELQAELNILKAEQALAEAEINKASEKQIANLRSQLGLAQRAKTLVDDQRQSQEELQGIQQSTLAVRQSNESNELGRQFLDERDQIESDLSSDSNEIKTNSVSVDAENAEVKSRSGDFTVSSDGRTAATEGVQINQSGVALGRLSNQERRRLREQGLTGKSLANEVFGISEKKVAEGGEALVKAGATIELAARQTVNLARTAFSGIALADRPGNIVELNARRYGGPVGPGGSYLVGEAPHVGPELGVFGGRSMLFNQPTILPSPPQGQIYSPEQTKRLMSAAPPSVSVGKNDAGLINEIKQLRRQVGRIRNVMPILEALADELVEDRGRYERRRRFQAGVDAIKEV